MAGDHMIQISWNGGNPEEIKPYAQKYYSKAIEYTGKYSHVKDALWESKMFFEEIILGKSYFGGSKGDLWLWGTVAKFPDMDIYLEAVLPFFKELWEKEIILKQRTVILFDEHSDESASMRIIVYNSQENDYYYKNLPENEVSVIGPYTVTEMCWRT